MAAKASPDGILVPKVSSIEDLDNHRPPPHRAWRRADGEGLGHDRDRARRAACGGAGRGGRDPSRRLSGFVFGPNDISRETRIRMLPGRAAMLPMITHCILATRAHGLEILDGPYSDIANPDGFATECAQARDLGSTARR